MGCLASGMTLEPTTTVQTGQHKRHYDVHSAVSQIHSGDCSVRVLWPTTQASRGLSSTFKVGVSNMDAWVSKDRATARRWRSPSQNMAFGR